MILLLLGLDLLIVILVVMIMTMFSDQNVHIPWGEPSRYGEPPMRNLRVLLEYGFSASASQYGESTRLGRSYQIG